MHDADLLRRIKQGDSAAWRAFYTSELPAVWRYAYALVGDRSVAEDISSETMLAMLRNLDKFDPHKWQIHAWLRGVVSNKVADHFRHVARQRKMLESVRHNSARESDLPKPVEIEEKRQHILRSLDRLAEQQRRALEWKYIDKISVREIANRLGQTEKSAESLLFRARREFRRLHNSDNIINERGESEQDFSGGSRL